MDKNPVYKMPREALAQSPWLTRRQILDGEVLSGRNLEIAWVDDPVELFFLQIQGSGRIRLPNGQYLRVGYRGANGHPYRSIGMELVRRGVYQPHQVSAEVIKNCCFTIRLMFFSAKSAKSPLRWGRWGP